MHSEINTLKNQEHISAMNLQDCRKEVNDIKEQLRKVEKSKSGIVAELEAEKNISQTKRQALEMATEEISKANEIIVKQSQELQKLKKTVAWRTEVALQQECAIKQNELILQEKNEEITFLKATINTLRCQITKEIEEMRLFAEALEGKYAERKYDDWIGWMGCLLSLSFLTTTLYHYLIFTEIHALKIKLELLDKENQPPMVNSRHSLGKSSSNRS